MEPAARAEQNREQIALPQSAHLDLAAVTREPP
jgi:hypothetical protein